MYRAIEAQNANFTVTRMTGLLEVSRSGFYKWRAAHAAGPSPAQQRREVIDAKVKEFHDTAFEDHLRTDLVESALSMAVTMRGQLPGQVIFHADRSTQYTCGPRAVRPPPRHHPIRRLNGVVLGQRSG